MSKNTKKKVCILVVGGVAEMRETHPERIRIVLKNRKGFIKVALTTGVDIVPVFTFGENEIYGLKMSELARKGDLWFKLDRVTLSQMKTKAFWCQFFKEFVTNLIYAIHLFTTLPKQRPLTTVVGKPIPVCKVKEPTQKQIDELHELYINELKALFDQHKEKYLDNKEINLEII